MFIRKIILPYTATDASFGFELDDTDEVDDEVGEVEEVACSAASFSSFLIRASCCRSDMGVWLGTEFIFLADDVTDVGEDPLLCNNFIVNNMILKLTSCY